MVVAWTQLVRLGVSPVSGTMAATEAPPHRANGRGLAHQEEPLMDDAQRIASLPERVAQCIRLDESGCWLWTGFLVRGYGRFWRQDEKRTVQAHRHVYELLVGPIPAGLHLDHQCHNEDESCEGGDTCRHRACVNPHHMDPCTNLENNRRSPLTIAGKNLRKTHCPQGHPLSGSNIFRDGKGNRQCKTCRYGWTDRWRANNPDYRKRGLEPGDHRHGTEHGYTGCGCRCDECREAHRVYRRSHLYPKKSA